MRARIANRSHMCPDPYNIDNGQQIINAKARMATDIRRMTREELDALNAEGKAWRERNNPVEDPHYHFHKFTPETTPAIQQLDLWEKEEK